MARGLWPVAAYQPLREPFCCQPVPPCQPLTLDQGFALALAASAFRSTADGALALHCRHCVRHAQLWSNPHLEALHVQYGSLGPLRTTGDALPSLGMLGAVEPWCLLSSLCAATTFSSFLAAALLLFSLLCH